MIELLQLSELKIGDTICLADTTNDYFLPAISYQVVPILIPGNLCNEIAYEEKLTKAIQILFADPGQTRFGFIRNVFESVFVKHVPGISHSYVRFHYDSIINVQEETQKFTSRHLQWKIQCLNSKMMNIMPSLSLPDNPRAIKLW